ARRVLAQVRIRGASRRVSRVKQGNGAARARKCGGQSSPGRYLPEDDIGDRWTGLDAEHPCLEYGGRMLCKPRHRKRAAVRQHDDDWLARREHFARELELTCRNADVGSAARLAAQVEMLSYHEHGRIGGLDELDRRGDARRVVIPRIGARGV